VTRLRTLEEKEFECLFTACFSRENITRGVILIGIIDLSELAAARHALEIMQTELAPCGTHLDPRRAKRVDYPQNQSTPKGMGMGLPICRSIVEAAGGAIELANRDDGASGARVMLTLPAL
jgi:nitrogen fixation/metabolism regulation signal transduction histidine kinase